MIAPSMEGPYEKWAHDSGLEVREHRGEGGKIKVSAGDGCWFTVVISDALTYDACTRRAAALRLDAPLLEGLLSERGELTVSFKIHGLPPGAPELASRARAKLELSPAGGILAQFSVSGAHVTYDLAPPVGLADLSSAFEDSILLAEPVTEERCQGACNETFGARPADQEDERLRKVLLSRWELCESCVNTLLASAVPLMPRAPKEWE